jgi:hypothetical protein
LTDIEKTKHYSINSLLLDGLLDFIPNDAYIIEPFYGRGDMVRDIKIKEYYDISFSKESEHYRDTLLNPPDYRNKWVITNPPYLAKNKAKDKKYFINNNFDDLYKIAINTMLECCGGILIIPINFFADEKSKNIRKLFFKNFSVQRLNIYFDSMFEKTNYNVCSFVFKRRENNNSNLIKTFLYGDNEIKETMLSLEELYDYRIGGDFFYELNQTEPIFSRVIENNKSQATNINVMCIDKRNEKINFYYSTNTIIGKQTDRNLATIAYKEKLSEDFQKELIKEANQILNDFRKSTYNICLTNYRDNNRKRIGFIEAYQILTMAYNKLNNI